MSSSLMERCLGDARAFLVGEKRPDEASPELRPWGSLGATIFHFHFVLTLDGMSKGAC